MAEPVVVAIDPGRDKCGLAVVSRGGVVLDHSIVPRPEMTAAVARLEKQHRPVCVIIGDRTGSRGCRAELAGRVGVPVVSVAEHGTTVRARERYFRDNPARGWLALLPKGLRVPPGPVDDYAAVLLGEDYWAAAPSGGSR